MRLEELLEKDVHIVVAHLSAEKDSVARTHVASSVLRNKVKRRCTYLEPRVKNLELMAG